MPAGRPGPGRQALATAVARTTGASVELRETHISLVALAGDRAFKLKKALALDFLDYSTPERRRHMCEEEVRLNRRLAPDMYLGVRGLVPGEEGLEMTGTDDPRACDYLVVMRRYDDEQTLAAAALRGSVRAADLTAVAETLAAFHAACEPVAPAAAGGARAAELEVDENVAELLRIVPDRETREQIRRLGAGLGACALRHAAELDARAGRGMVRDGHGDLRAEHVLLGPPPAVVDCVEFDPALRALDVADDLAFLVMDLVRLGDEAAAGGLLRGYRAAGGDCGSDSLVAFFAAHRALIRAKVAWLRAAQLSEEEPARAAAAKAPTLVALAERFLWRARLPLALVVCGVPASGKSHLARALADASGLARMGSDLVRKELAGVGSDEAAPAERYRAEFSLRTYRELGKRAAAELGQAGGVIVDATFRRRADRDAFRDGFDSAGPAVFIECRVPVEVLAERAAARDRGPRGPSDATLPVVMRERLHWQALDEVPPAAHVQLRGDRPAPSLLREIAARLDA